MKAVLLACIIVASLSIDVSNKAWTNRETQILAEIQNSNWASFILNFAELHMKTNGVLQELLQEIEALIEDLNEELNEITQAFGRRTDQHNRDVIRLEQEIQDADRANIDLFNANDMIDNVLYPMRDRLNKALAQLKDNIDTNRKNLDEETLVRNKEIQVFEAKVAEHNEAIEAIDECLALLSQITNPSLVQIEKIQTTLQKLDTKYAGHSVFAPMVKALLELATEQNFADQGAIKNVINAFNELRVEIVNSLNQETADEAERKVEFAARVDQLNAEYAEFQRQVMLRNAELTATNDKLAATQDYAGQRKIDRDTLQAQLQAENDNYAQETQIFEDLKAQYLKELGASEKALALLTQPSFEAYVKGQLGF